MELDQLFVSPTRSHGGRGDEIQPSGADPYNATIKQMCQKVVDLSRQAQPKEMKTAIQSLHRFTVKMARVHHVDLEDSLRESKRLKSRALSTRESSQSLEAESSEAEQDESDSRRTTSFDTRDDREDSNEQMIEQAVERRLEKLVLSMTIDVDIDALAAMQKRFITRMQGLEITVTKDNKQFNTTFSAEEIAAIANFFFSDLIGPKALKRLQELVNFYAAPEDRRIDRGLAARASMLAQDNKTPEMLRPFFGAFSRAAEHDSEQSRVFKHVQQVLRSLEFIKEYNQLKLKALDKDAVLTAALKEKGYPTKKGVTVMSCLIKFLCTSLKISRVTLSNTVQSHTGIETLVEYFGEGLVVLLPPGSGHRLAHWGNQKMSHVYPILQEELQCLQGLCEYVGIHLLDRIREGKPIPFGQIKTGNKLSLQERIQEAVEEVEGEELEDEALEGEALEDEALEDEALEGEALEDEALEDAASEGDETD